LLITHSIGWTGLLPLHAASTQQPPICFATPRVPVDLGQIVGGLIQIQSAAKRDLTIILTSHDLTMSADLVPELLVLGNEGALSTAGLRRRRHNRARGQKCR
jgi:hypothetical protein